MVNEERAEHEAAAAAPATLAFRDLYEAHAAFLWRTVRRLGVRASDVEDVCQEAFIVAHRKMSSFVGGSQRAWLFAIGQRVASDYRKRAYVRREVVGDDAGMSDARVEENATRRLEVVDAREALDSLLDQLDESQRAVFVLYELEEMPMAEIAESLACPLQTAYSRLHAAREIVSRGIARLRAREERETGGRP